MSVVVRCPDGRVRVMSKGADTTMMPLLRGDTPEVSNARVYGEEFVERALV